MSSSDRSAAARRLRSVAAPGPRPWPGADASSVAARRAGPAADTGVALAAGPPAAPASAPPIAEAAVGSAGGSPRAALRTEAVGAIASTAAAIRAQSPGEEPGPSAAPPTATAGCGSVSAAVRVAADDFARTHPDPRADEDEKPAPGGVRRPRDVRRMRWSLSWRAAGTAALALSLVVGAVVLRSVALTPGAAVELPDPAPLGTPAAGESARPGPTSSLGPAVVVVHVVGAVAAPGVVRLPAGSRVLDAVAAAGGGTDDADLARLNLARVLVDGEQVVVPRPGDPSPTTGTAPDGGPSAGLVDLNGATLVQLDGLPGVGPVLAQRIVDRRPFTSVDELDEVSGVGPTLLERLRPLVRV